MMRTPASSPGPIERFFAMISDPTLGAAVRAIVGLLLFVVGWLLAKLISWGVYRLLTRLLADGRVAEVLGVRGSTALPVQVEGEPKKRSVEETASQVVYYLLLLLAAIGVLEFAGVGETSGKLQVVIDRVNHALPLVGRALLTMVVAFVVGRILEKGTTKIVEGLGLDRRLSEMNKATGTAAVVPVDPNAPPAPPEARFSERVGRVTFWLIMCFGLLSALDALAIGQLSGPLHRALERASDLLPAVGAGALLLIGGYLIGRVARLVVKNLLEAAGFNKLMARLQLDKPFRKTSPSQAVGNLAMLVILIQAGIAALNELELSTLSSPLTSLMSRIYARIPSLGLAIVIVAIGVLVGRLARSWVEGVLKNLGLDRLLERIGLAKLRTQKEGLATPSEVLGVAAYIGIVLIALAQAFDALTLTTWAGYVQAVLSFAVERLGVALIILGIGFGVGNYVRRVIMTRPEGEEGMRWIGGAARYAVLVFAFTVAIHQLGVAEDFVKTAFILLLGALCLALALALGLGGRDLAGELVRRQFDKARGRSEDRKE